MGEAKINGPDKDAVLLKIAECQAELNAVVYKHFGEAIDGPLAPDGKPFVRIDVNDVAGCLASLLSQYIDRIEDRKFRDELTHKTITFIGQKAVQNEIARQKAEQAKRPAILMPPGYPQRRR